MRKQHKDKKRRYYSTALQLIIDINKNYKMKSREKYKKTIKSKETEWIHARF